MRTSVESKGWLVSEVAERAHVTVRTLHHYDEIGLLVPAERSDAGYRLYSESDLERLFQVLLYRELGFPLEAIACMLDEPAVDRREALRAQRELLIEKQRKTGAVIRALDRMLESLEKAKPMNTEELFEGMEAFADAPREIREHQAKHAQEVQERWGKTSAYEESMRRAKSYSKADWQTIQGEAAANESRMMELLAAGADPEGDDAMDCAEAMRQHIHRWFYPCDHRMHAGLADMYEADPRFTEYYEKRAEGLAAYVATAIRANAIRAWRVRPTAQPASREAWPSAAKSTGERVGHLL
jgi:MerR family transcriptional regulator, thiopeptide resistance regulator